MINDVVNANLVSHCKLAQALWPSDLFFSLGEAIGWAHPDKCPPRINRTNKALRAFGHEIGLLPDLSYHRVIAA